MKAPAYDTEPLSESFIGQSLPTIKKGKNRLKKGKCLNGTSRAKFALAGQFWQLKINATSVPWSFPDASYRANSQCAPSQHGSRFPGNKTSVLTWEAAFIRCWLESRAKIRYEP